MPADLGPNPASFLGESFIQVLLPLQLRAMVRSHGHQAVRTESVLVAFITLFPKRNTEIRDRQMVRGQDSVIFPPGRTLRPERS